MIGLKDKVLPHVDAGGAEGMCELRAGNVVPLLFHLEISEGCVGVGCLV